ncbi:N,N'-diacetylchitobiose transport system substrate-binding protein [Amycolatopsis sulphurea]|uniref:N,N'-diacetylchitobiose transport system substrate-binding protein n=1 Tax=Amycolatopsis sulphurea TaxID=76022 RepID=A0A2A9FES1_9PSEU|nr:extracellular solute-binding protein [Amycolatopsis sulphurea]PFG49947.1 N,N'-diacetylchitobiose transport system substrate-binding protein [Amycolatopsis sulphurea]
MRRSRTWAWLTAAIGVVVVVLAAGCGPGGAGGRTLTVWLMSGPVPDDTVNAIGKDFEAAHPGVKVDYQVQQWDGIGQKLTTALTRGSGGPDIIELGTTQDAQYTSQGALQDLTGSVGEFNGPQWLPTLKESGAYGGKQYGVPFYAASRVVVYRTDLFRQAGITAPPASAGEWLADLARLKALPGVDPLYLPGQNWYALLSFIWDHGGDLAHHEGGTWRSTLNTPEAKAGFAFYKQLVDTSGTTAAKDTDEATPQQSDVIAKGDTASFIGFGSDLAEVIASNPSLKDKFSAFPIPSRAAGKTAPVLEAGSILAIPANSKNADLAKDWLKIETSAKYQAQLAATDSVPGTSTDTTALQATPVGRAMVAASKDGKVTPVTPRWTAVEADNPLKSALTAYLTGKKSLDQAVSDADSAITKTLTSSS